jgi:hypothetical protein
VATQTASQAEEYEASVTMVLRVGSEDPAPSVFPLLVWPEKHSSGVPKLRHPLLDAHLELVSVRLRPNSTLAVAYDLEVFFAGIAKNPLEVQQADFVEFIPVRRSNPGLPPLRTQSSATPKAAVSALA